MYCGYLHPGSLFTIIQNTGSEHPHGYIHDLSIFQMPPEHVIIPAIEKALRQESF